MVNSLLSRPRILNYKNEFIYWVFGFIFLMLWRVQNHFAKNITTCQISSSVGLRTSYPDG